MTQLNFTKIFIIPSILISPILSTSMNSWFMIWSSLEFNMMSFIPFIIFFNKYYKNLTTKYFIIQAFSSSLLIMNSNFLIINHNKFYTMMIIMINLSILIKLGSAPFHSWFINLMNNLNWITCLILSTWQKIIPLIMLMYIFNYKIIYISSILSSITGTMMALNHQSLRLIMSYSSINHISWMLMSMMISETLWNLYFISYMSINMSIMMILNKMNIYNINQLFITNNNYMNKLFLFVNMLSIGSIPPMFGFMMKWFSLYMMNWNNNMIMIFILIILSTLTFMFYMRLYMCFLIQFNWNSKLILINKFINLKSIKLKYYMIFNSFLNLWMLNLWLN